MKPKCDLFHEAGSRGTLGCLATFLAHLAIFFATYSRRTLGFPASLFSGNAPHRGNQWSLGDPEGAFALLMQRKYICLVGGCRAVAFRCLVGFALLLAACKSSPTPPTSAIRIVGAGQSANLDSAVIAFMLEQNVKNAELAVSINGTVAFSHAYTYNGLAESLTTPETIMRLASNTKAWTDAELTNLASEGKISLDTPVFGYLHITKPLPEGAHVDPRVYEITIGNMIYHRSGWDDQKSGYDPTFAMRQTALALGLKRSITQLEFVRYQLHEPLQEQPGTTYAYCNFCYTVLGMVIAKATGLSYENAIARDVAQKLHVNNVLRSPNIGNRLPQEVALYYSKFSGLSGIFVTSDKLWPAPYSGNGMVMSVSQGAAELATNADSMLALMKHYVIWMGIGTPRPGQNLAREGSLAGTNTWAEQLPNGTNYAFLINTRDYTYQCAFADLQNTIEVTLDPGHGVEHKSGCQNAQPKEERY